MALEHRILVAGFNYENPKNPMFLQCCNNRMTRFLEKSSHPDDLVFTLFDVAGGTVRQSRVDTKTKRRGWTDLPGFSFKTVTTANYSKFVVGNENHFDTNPDKIMSITDVYTFVQSIGTGTEKGTVEELNFFSHGWMGGPILVNSFDATANDPSKPRDPADKDARYLKDFIAPNMDATAILNFNAAFSGDGFVWTWGCSFARSLNVVLSRLFSTHLLKTTPLNKLKDTDKVTLDFSDDAKPPTPDDDFNVIVHSYFPGGKLSHNSYTITVTIKQIKELLQQRMGATYTAWLSNATGISSIGALPGTYADGEKNVRLPQMVIPQRKPPYDDDLSRSVKFYITVAGATQDPENRGYGQY
jgi:hypothetical protein